MYLYIWNSLYDLLIFHVDIIINFFIINFTWLLNIKSNKFSEVIQIEHWIPSFQDFRVFHLQEPSCRNPKKFRAGSVELPDIREQSMRETLGFCHRVIVNETLLNLKKTTSSVVSVLLFIISCSSRLNFYWDIVSLI